MDRRFAALLAAFALTVVGRRMQQRRRRRRRRGGRGGEESDVIRFTFAPDPAWDWMKDQGILETMETGVRVPDHPARHLGRVRDVRRRSRRRRLDRHVRDPAARGAGDRDRDVRSVQHEQGHARHGQPGVRDGVGLPGRVQDRDRVGHRQHDHLGSLIKEIDGREVAEGSDDIGIVTGRLPDHPHAREGGRGVRRDRRPHPGDPRGGVGRV